MCKSEARMFEFACHKGNYALPGMLRGARVLEAEVVATGETLYSLDAR